MKSEPSPSVSNTGHRVMEGGRYGGSGGNSGSNEDLAGVGDSGGTTETGINDSPINITINDSSVNQQTWKSSVSPVLEWVHDNRFTSPEVGRVGRWRRVVSRRGAGWVWERKFIQNVTHAGDVTTTPPVVADGGSCAASRSEDNRNTVGFGICYDSWNCESSGKFVWLVWKDLSVTAIGVMN